MTTSPTGISYHGRKHTVPLVSDLGAWRVGEVSPATVRTATFEGSTPVVELMVDGRPLEFSAAEARDLATALLHAADDADQVAREL